MKIAIAAMASLAMAGSAFAAVPSMSNEKRPPTKVKQLELAAGKSRPGQVTTSSVKISNGRTFR